MREAAAGEAQDLGRTGWGTATKEKTRSVSACSVMSSLILENKWWCGHFSPTSCAWMYGLGHTCVYSCGANAYEVLRHQGEGLFNSKDVG